MSVTSVDRGTVSNNTTTTSWAITCPTSFVAGGVAVLCTAMDNSEATGLDPFVSISDSLGNTWTSVANVLNNPAGVSSGTAGRIFTTPMNGGVLTNTTVITITLSPTTVSKVATLLQLTSSNGVVPALVASGTNTGNSTAPTVTTASIGATTLLLGMTAVEASAAVTGDSDTTNGVWTSQQYISVGSGVAGQGISTQTKATTGTGAQTYNTSTAAAQDWGVIWALFNESPQAPAMSTTTIYAGTFLPTVLANENNTPSPRNFQVFDRVQETTTVTGTGTATLLGAVTGYQSFAVVANENLCAYAIVAVDGSGSPTGQWEVGIGVYSTTGPTLTRDSIRASTSSNQRVVFAAGTKRVLLVNDAQEIQYKPILGVVDAMNNNTQVI